MGEALALRSRLLAMLMQPSPVSASSLSFEHELLPCANLIEYCALSESETPLFSVKTKETSPELSENKSRHRATFMASFVEVS